MYSPLQTAWPSCDTMSFHHSEHLVTAFLCISGAAESCVLPFLCLHLSQLGVPPLQTSLAVAALLLLRGLGGALWWRSLRGGRRTGRRRLAAAVGALCSAAVLCALAALPPSVGCGDDGGVVVEHASSLPGLRPPGDIVPAAGLGQGTDGEAGSGGSSWSGLPPSPDGSRPPSGRGDGGFYPPPVSQGSGSSWSESGDSWAESSGMPQHQSVGSQSSDHQRLETSETSGNQRPETNETSDHHWLETSEHLRPETSETSGHYQPEISETSGHYQPETSETSGQYRPETSHTSPDHEPETIENSSVNRPTNSGVTEVNRPIDVDTGINNRPSPSETNIHDRPEQSETNEQSDSSTMVQMTEGSLWSDSHAPNRTTPEIDSRPPPSPPSVAAEWPSVPSVQSGVSSSSVEGETDDSSRPSRVEGAEKGTGDGETKKEGGDEWSESSQTQSPTVVNGSKAKPQRHHPKHDNAQKKPSGSQAESSHAHGADVSQGNVELSGPQTEDVSGMETIPGIDHHTSNVPPAVTPSAQKPPPTGSQTPGKRRPPVLPSGHQTSAVVNSLLEDDTEVRRTTRSPPPLESEEDDSREGSESGQAESETDVFGEETEPVSSGNNKHHKSDEFHQSDNHLPPSPGSGRDSSELITVTSNLSVEQDRTDKPDQLLPVAPPHSYSGDERDDHHVERQHPNQHHRHHATEVQANDKSKDTGRQPSTAGSMVYATVDLDSIRPAHNEHHHTASHQRPTSGSSINRDSGTSDALEPHPSVQRRPVPPESEESDNEAQPCVELSQIEIPWDPRKHPGGLTICDPSKPETGQRRGEGSSQPPGVDRGMLPGVETRQQTGHRPEHGSAHQRTHSVQRHRAPPAPPPPATSNHDLSDLSPTNRDLSDLASTNRDPSKPVSAIHDLPDLPKANHNPPDLASTRGQPGPPSGHDPGRSRHRAAGWRRVPVWSGDDQTPDHPHSVVSDPEPPTQPPPIVLVLRGTDSDSSGERKNYNTLDLTKDAVDLSSVILRPQDTLPLLSIPVERVESDNRAKTQNRVASEGINDLGDRTKSESGLGSNDRGPDPARGPLPATKPRRLEMQHYPSRDANAAVSSPASPSVNERLRVPGEELVSGHGTLNPGVRHESRNADRVSNRGETHPAVADVDDRSYDRPKILIMEKDVQSRDQSSNVRPSAELGSRDFPRTVDPSGWSRRQLTGSTEGDSSEQGISVYTTNRETENRATSDNEDRESPDSKGRGISDIKGRMIQESGNREVPDGGRYSNLPDSEGTEEVQDRTALVTGNKETEYRQAPSSPIFNHDPHQPGGGKAQHHDGRLPSRRHPNGDPRRYKLHPRPADDRPTIEPTTGWSLTSALHRLEDLSPTLNRLLSGGKRRRETRQRRREKNRRRWREGDRRHRRRRYKRSLLSGLTGWRDLREDDTEKDTRREELNNRWEVVRRVPERVSLERTVDDREEAGMPARSQFQPRARPASRYLHAESDEAKGWSYNFSKSLERQSQLFQVRSDRDLRSVSVPSAPTSPHSSSLDPYLLFLITLALLSLWGTAGAPHRRLVLHCWRHALDEAEHLERVERPRPAAEAAAAALLATAAGLWPLLPSCLPAGRQPLAALMALGAALTLLGGMMVPWLPMVAGKEPPQRTAAVVRTLVSSRSSLLFTIAVFVTGLLTSAEFHFLFPLTATWRPAPRALLLLAAAAALASRLPVRALYRPLMVRCGFVGSVVLSFTALSTRCLCYVCIPTGWALVTAQLLSGLTETLFWRAAHVFVDKTTHDDFHQSTLGVLEALYAVGRCCGVLLAGAAFSTVGGTATFAALATVASAAALGYYVAARFSGDAPDLTYSKLPCEDGADTTALTGSWSRDTDDPDEVTDPPPAPGADQDWLERAMRQEGLL